MKKSHIAIALSSLAVVSICVALAINIVLRLLYPIAHTDKILIRDYESLTITAQFLMCPTFRRGVRISRDRMTNNEVLVFDVGVIEVEDSIVVDALNELRSRSYNVITRHGNTITFQRWATRNVGRGIAFSIDGNEPTLESITTLEPLSKPNWFFYIQNYWEWQRRRNQDK